MPNQEMRVTAEKGRSEQPESIEELVGKKIWANLVHSGLIWKILGTRNRPGKDALELSHVDLKYDHVDFWPELAQKGGFIVVDPRLVKKFSPSDEGDATVGVGPLHFTLEYAFPDLQARRVHAELMWARVTTNEKEAFAKEMVEQVAQRWEAKYGTHRTDEVLLAEQEKYSGPFEGDTTEEREANRGYFWEEVRIGRSRLADIQLIKDALLHSVSTLEINPNNGSLRIRCPEIPTSKA